MLDAFMPLSALMHDKGICEPQKFDTAELLDGILAVREFLRLQQDTQANKEDLSLANTAVAESLFPIKVSDSSVHELASVE